MFFPPGSELNARITIAFLKYNPEDFPSSCQTRQWKQMSYPQITAWDMQDLMLYDYFFGVEKPK